MELLKRIAALSNGDILCVIQAASEMPDTYTLEQALTAGLEETVAG